MKLKKILGLSLLGCTLGLAHAESGNVGNGGNGVVCYTDMTKKVVASMQMFDHWEMGQVYAGKFKLVMRGDQATVLENVKTVTDRIAQYDAIRAQSYLGVATDIINNIDQLLYSDELPTIDDDNSSYRPVAPCYKEQFAVQIRDPEDGKRFLINKRMWSHPKAGSMMKAGLILHEVMYREFIENGSLNSDLTREMNFLASSDALTNLTGAQYASLIKTKFKLEPLAIRLLDAYLGSLPLIVQLKKSTVREDANGLDGYLAAPFMIKNNQIEGKVEIAPQYNPYARDVTFKKVNGKLMLTVMDNYPPVQWRENTRYKLFRYLPNQSTAILTNRIVNWAIDFHPNGLLKTGIVLSGIMNIPHVDGMIECGEGEFEFWDNGQLKFCLLNKPQSFRVGNQSISATMVALTKDGRIEKLVLRENTLLSVQGCLAPIEMAAESFVSLNAAGRMTLIEGAQADISLETKDFGDETYWFQHQNPPRFTYGGQTYSMRSGLFSQSACEFTETLPVYVKQKNGLELFLPVGTSTQVLNQKADQFCKTEGMDTIIGALSTLINNDILFKKVFSLSTMKETEIPIGKDYGRVSMNCSKKLTLKI